MKFRKDRFYAIFQREPEFEIVGVCPATSLKDNCMTFNLYPDQDFYLNLSKRKSCIAFVTDNVPVPENFSEKHLIITCINPRFSYIRATSECMIEEDEITGVSESSFIHPSVKMGVGVTVEPFAYVGPDCIIADNCKIKSGAKLIRNVNVGTNSCIGVNSVIGEKGFGIERDNGLKREVISFGGRPHKMPHFGGVVIGEYCDIGSLNTICAGAMRPTVIKDYVVTDDHVHVAHNCIIGEGTAIAACAEISGSVTVGNECWIGPNVSVMQKVKIGAKSTLGIGTVVLHSFEESSVLVGNPARDLNR